MILPLATYKRIPDKPYEFDKPFEIYLSIYGLEFYVFTLVSLAP